MSCIAAFFIARVGGSRAIRFEFTDTLEVCRASWCVEGNRIVIAAVSLRHLESIQIGVRIFLGPPSADLASSALRFAAILRISKGGVRFGDIPRIIYTRT